MHTTRSTRKATLAMLAVLMAILLASSQASNAWAATTGFDIGSGTIQMSYGHDSTVDKSWNEHVLTVDDEWVYCVEVDDDFVRNIEVSREDPVKTGRWSQELVTELALASDFVWAGKFKTSTNSGSRLVKDNREKYAITQVMIWDILNRHGYSNHGWFSASLDGIPLTGVGDGWAECMAYIEAHKDSYIGHANYYDGGTTQSVACGFWTEPTNGSIELVKHSANESITKGNGCYSLKGAVYGVFEKKSTARERDETKALATYKTDSKGSWSSGDDFKAGTYYVAETKAPSGYALDESVYTVEVEAGSQVLVNADVGHVSDEPQSNPVTLWASKQDAQTADHGAQGSATLAGTLFEIAYYDGYYRPSNLPATPTRTWVVTCAADGKAYPRDDLKVGGDDFYRTDAGDVTIPLGTVTVREKAAPNGYREGSASETKVIQIKASDAGKTLGVYTAPIFANEVMRGGLAVGKVDRQNKSYAPQGAATLAGATFAIVTNNDQQVIVDGTRHVRGDVVKTIETKLVNGKYIAQTPSDCLPVGRYTVRETSSSAGYLFDATSREWEQSFEISADGQVVNLTDPNKAVSNQAIRGDFGFSKVDGITDKRIGNVPFLVTSNTTGESHVLMADENGMASTAADWNPHTKRTNSNDKAVKAEGGRYTVDESLLDNSAGIWFNGNLEAPCNPNEDLGALPYDTYTVTELPVKANEGYELVMFSVRIARHARELDLGTVDDNPGPAIATSLADENGAHLAPAAESIQLIDTVHYTNLDVRQTYTLKGKLYLVKDESADEAAAGDPTANDTPAEDSASGQTVSNAESATADDDGAMGCELFAVQEIAFTPKSATGSADVAFTVDTSKLGGMRLVAFEELYDAQDLLVAEHADISDADQTIFIPEIGTTLADGIDQSHETPSCGAVELVDTVSYRGLKPGITYLATGTLHLRAEDGADEGPALDENGRTIEAVQPFTPDAPDGSVEVPFSFTAPALAGRTVVAFEELGYRGVAYAVHANIADEGQSVRMPGIGTTLVDSADGDHAAAADEAITLVDVVSYHGLTPGVTYAIAGTLHVRNSDGSDAGPALDENGEAVTAMETFTPESESGETSVTFAFAAPALAGRTVVAFEELSHDGRTYAVHADISDVDQTVWFNPPRTEEGEPPEETPPAETPPQQTPPQQTPPTETTPPGKGTLPRTGDGINLFPLAFLAAGATGLVAAALCVRRMRRDNEITIDRGPNRTQDETSTTARCGLPAQDRPRSERLPQP